MYKTSLLLALFLFTTTSFAERVTMDDKNICNGYTAYTGKVTDVIATTTYNGYENVYANLKLDKGGYQGGGYLLQITLYSRLYTDDKISNAGEYHWRENRFLHARKRESNLCSSNFK